MIPLIQQLVVQDKKWMDEDEMLDCIADKSVDARCR